MERAGSSAGGADRAQATIFSQGGAMDPDAGLSELLAQAGHAGRRRSPAAEPRCSGDPEAIGESKTSAKQL